MTDSAANRRAFLTGRALAGQIRTAGEALADGLVAEEPPSRGPTVLLRTTAMATDFDVLLNPDGPPDQLRVASEALDEVYLLEQQLTVYREDSDLMQLNRRAAEAPVAPGDMIYRLLRRGAEIASRTGGAFDHASGALIRLWSTCKRSARIPTADEVAGALASSGLAHVRFDDSLQTIAFERPGIEFNLGAIGKGFAVDQVCECLLAAGVPSFLAHGGKSSVRAHGGHNGHRGWPVGIRNPLRPDRPYLTLLLENAALCTSGTAAQWFRVDGKRYGHIVDPRSGWPVDSMLSVSVIAPDAALADALSTAFFVLGVEKALSACDNFVNVAAILFPYPTDGRTLAPVLHRVLPKQICWTDPASSGGR